MTPKRKQFDIAEHAALDALFNRYLHRTCGAITIIENRWHPFDALLLSGSSEKRVLMEMKVRDCTASRFFNEGAMLEQKKFEALKEEHMKDRTKPPVLFINTFIDGYVVIWNITKHFHSNTLVSGTTVCPWKTHVDLGQVLKPVFYLLFQNCDTILRTGTYECLRHDTFFNEMRKHQAEDDAFIAEFLKNHNISL